MADRRTLTEGLTTKLPPPLDPATERVLIHAASKQAAGQGGQATPIRRVPLTTRVREDLAKALKRASLERQLEGVHPSALQEILEQAIEPWLKANGYLS
jgi:hypothetical protein